MEDTEVKTTKNDEMPLTTIDEHKKGTPSKRQVEHLKYAREMRKLKQEQKNHLNQVHNDNLTLIHKRLTQIESQVQSIAEERPIVAQKTGLKRSLSKTEEETLEEAHKIAKRLKKSIETKDKLKKSEERQNLEVSKPNSIRTHFFTESYNNILYYGGRALFVFGSGIALQLLKNAYANYARTTNDGDTVGGYYIGKDV